MAAAPLPPSLAARSAVWMPAIEAELARSIEQRRGGAPDRLLDAMAHSLLAGGKRVRPLIVLEAHRMFVDSDDAELLERSSAWPAALAVEYVHTYSLIHDDLPALDDDELRRGRPTVHLAFDEATAILAGDALLTDAFELLARSTVRAAEQCAELARAAGSSGMVAGQLVDLRSEGQDRSREQLEAIHANKTGKLFEAAAALGGWAANAPADAVAALRRYGGLLGLAFQIADDVLDVTGDEDARGKRAGGDVRHDKATYVKALGLEGARSLAHEVAERAVGELQGIDGDVEMLVGLARFAATRPT